MTCLTRTCRARGFTLVEITISIGIFAFVVVAILGMFPTALRLRTESSLETRAVMIANQLFAAVRTAPNISNVVLWAGPSPSTNSLAGNKAVVVGYPVNASVPVFLETNNADGAWERGEMSAEATSREVQTLAKLAATKLTNRLYQVTVEVRAPAVARLERTPPLVFTTYHYAP